MSMFDPLTYWMQNYNCSIMINVVIVFINVFIILLFNA